MTISVPKKNAETWTFVNLGQSNRVTEPCRFVGFGGAPRLGDDEVSGRVLSAVFLWPIGCWDSYRFLLVFGCMEQGVYRIGLAG